MLPQRHGRRNAHLAEWPPNSLPRACIELGRLEARQRLGLGSHCLGSRHASTCPPLLCLGACLRTPQAKELFSAFLPGMSLSCGEGQGHAGLAKKIDRKMSQQGHALCNRSLSATPRLPLWAASRATRHPSAGLTRAGLAAGAAAANVVPSAQVHHCIAIDNQFALSP